jgi:hypothetical protein
MILDSSVNEIMKTSSQQMLLHLSCQHGIPQAAIQARLTKPEVHFNHCSKHLLNSAHSVILM